MSIASMKTAPAVYSMNAAYRPVVIEPRWDTSVGPFPPIVYCDVYAKNISGANVLIRTLTSTTYNQETAFVGPYWTFDIQDAIQDFIKSSPQILSSISINPTPQDILFNSPSFINCTCYFRWGVVDANGFVSPNANPDPSSGVGPANFFVLNTVLQHEDIQVLQTHLASYRKTPFIDGMKRYLPLTHRQDGYLVGKNDYDYFPVFVQPVSSTSDEAVMLIIRYRLDGDGYNNWRSATTALNQASKNSYPNMIPSGLASLRNMSWNDYAFPPGTLIPKTIDFDRVIEYYLQIGSVAAGVLSEAFTTIKFKVKQCHSELRVWFQNNVGYFDRALFDKAEITTKTTSTVWRKALSVPLNQSDGGNRRFNVQSNESYKAVTYSYPEDKQIWLKELFDTAIAFIETTIQDGTIKLIPIKITDGDFVYKKIEGRFLYETTLQFEMANENIRQRN